MTVATSFETTITNALNAETQGVKFPLKFNDVWKESGYTRKNNAVKAFKENCLDLIQGEDYDFDYSVSQNIKQRGRPHDDILLTVEAYNFFLARARTPEGTAKLKYLILIEKNYRESLNRQLTASVQPQVDLKEFEAKIRKEEGAKIKKEIASAYKCLKEADKQFSAIAQENDDLRLKLESQKSQEDEILKDIIKDLIEELNTTKYRLSQVGSPADIQNAQKACYLSLKMCKKHISDYEDIMETGFGSVEYYAEKLIPVLSKKVRQTFELSHKINELMGFYVDVFEELYGTEEHNTHFTEY